MLSYGHVCDFVTCKVRSAWSWCKSVRACILPVYSLWFQNLNMKNLDFEHWSINLYSYIDKQLEETYFILKFKY
jgi:hypothetical protein